MRITLLGTSAGEGYPGFFCDCEHCHYARTHGGKNIRGNSSALIDDDLLIDMNAHSFEMFARLGISPLGLRHLLVTHAHIDHFDPQKLTQRAVWADIDAPSETLHRQISPCMSRLPQMIVHGNACVRDAIEAVPGIMKNFDRYNFTFASIENGRAEMWDDFSFIPVCSQHGPLPGFSHNYILMRGGKTLLYASDTGGYTPEMLEIIAAHRYDCVIMEGTFGLGASVDGHMSLEKNRRMLDFFVKHGLFKGKVNFILTHICPHWAPPHDLYESIVNAEGMILGYDGKIIEC